MALLADPVLLLRYKAEWDVWLKELPQLARAPASPNGTTPLWRQGLYAGRDGSGVGEEWTMPVASERSVLSKARLTCAKWSLLSTILAFYRSATTALSITPLVSMGAIALFTRSILISYFALCKCTGIPTCAPFAFSPLAAAPLLQPPLLQPPPVLQLADGRVFETRSSQTALREW